MAEEDPDKLIYTNRILGSSRAALYNCLVPKRSCQPVSLEKNQDKGWNLFGSLFGAIKGVEHKRIRELTQGGGVWYWNRTQLGMESQRGCLYLEGRTEGAGVEGKEKNLPKT